MDAPWWEMTSRVITAVISTGVAAILLYGMVHYVRHIPVRWLYWNLTAVITFIAVWRWYIVWVGAQHDHDGSYARDVEPVVRVVGQVQLDLLLLAVGLVAGFHAWRTMRSGKDDADG